QAVLDLLHTFAADVLRPNGMRLDGMTAEEVAAPGSPMWETFEEFLKLGLDFDLLLHMPPEPMAKLLSLAVEILGWGDAGLAGALLVSGVPRMVAQKFGNPVLLERLPPSKIGCWAVTEPHHGSDMLDWAGEVRHLDGDYGAPDCVARLYCDRVV